MRALPALQYSHQASIIHAVHRHTSNAGVQVCLVLSAHRPRAKRALHVLTAEGGGNHC